MATLKTRLLVSAFVSLTLGACDGSQPTDAGAGSGPDASRGDAGVTMPDAAAADAGAPTPDGGGACVPVSEICGDAVDNNCDGEIDEGCAPEVCDALAAEMTRTTPLADRVRTGSDDPPVAAGWNPEPGELGLAHGGPADAVYPSGRQPDVRFLRVALDGAVLSSEVLWHEDGAVLHEAGGVVWTGSRWVVVFVRRTFPADGPRLNGVYAIAADAEGVAMGAPLLISELGEQRLDAAHVLATATDLYVSWVVDRGASAARVARLDEGLTTVRSRIDLAAQWVTDLAWSGDSLGVLSRSTTEDSVTFSLVRDDAIVAQHSLSTSPRAGQPRIAYGAGIFMGCWSARPHLGSGPVQCHRISGDGTFLGDLILATPPATREPDVAWNGCAFVVSGANTNLGEWARYVSTLSAGGEVQATLNLPLDRTGGDLRQQSLLPIRAGVTLAELYEQRSTSLSHIEQTSLR